MVSMGTETKQAYKEGLTPVFLLCNHSVVSTPRPKKIKGALAHMEHTITLKIA